jgi:hypothetical protein
MTISIHRAMENNNNGFAPPQKKRQNENFVAEIFTLATCKITIKHHLVQPITRATHLTAFFHENGMFLITANRKRIKLAY